MSDDEYYEDEDAPRRPKKRRPVRRQFAEGATEGSGGTLTKVREEEDDTDDEASDGSKPVIRRGWGASQTAMDNQSTYAQRLDVGADDILIKFLEDAPYAGYSRHWIKRTFDSGPATVPYVCLNSVESGPCPLCDIGDRPQAVSAFNVALIDDDGTPSLKTWDVGARIFGTLKKYNNDQRNGPLTKGYFLVSKTGKGTKSNTSVVPTRESTLKEDGFIVPTAADFERLGLYDSSIIDVQTRKTLKEIAAEQQADDEYYD